MQQIIETVAAALTKRGMNHSNQGTWAGYGVTVTFRPQDDSFQGHWTDGNLQEYVFFDFPKTDPEQCHFRFVMLLRWVEDRRARTIRGWLASEADCPLAA